MSPDPMVNILFVEEDLSVYPRVEAFFRYQLDLIGAHPHLHFRPRIPERAVGFDLVSLDGRGLISALLDHPGLVGDLRQTAILNLHADDPGATYGHLRRLLGRSSQGLRSDGLWVFPQSWMAPWFREHLGFPELEKAARPLTLPRRPSPDRTWERRSVGVLNPTIQWRGQVVVAG